MKQIHFATKNKGKVFTFQKSLEKYDIGVVHVSMDLPEPRTYDLKEIARHKAVYAFEKIQTPCIAVDTGFYIDSLKGFPRSFVNFTLETIGLEGILKLVENKNHDCHFDSYLAYLDENICEPLFFYSSVKGVLSDSIKGETKDYQWSELWKIFIPAEETKTLAEMSLEEYENWRFKRISSSFVEKFGAWYSRSRSRLK